MGALLGAKDYTDPAVQAAVTDDDAAKAIKEGFKTQEGKTAMNRPPLCRTATSRAWWLTCGLLRSNSRHDRNPALDYNAVPGFQNGVDLPAGLLVAGRGRRLGPGQGPRRKSQPRMPRPGPRKKPRQRSRQLHRQRLRSRLRQNSRTPIASIVILIPAPPGSSTGRPKRWFSRRPRSPNRSTPSSPASIATPA